MDYAILLEHVSKKYKLYRNQKERFLDLILPKDYGENFYALEDVSFKAQKGEVIGFIGVNGSGKSTLLNVISGIIPETAGRVEVNGKTSIIAVSSGLKDNLTGRENIELKCMMLGFTKKEIRSLEPHIVEFAELGKFIDQPLKMYSSGMKSRLGFAISVNVDPDILIIDEALSVGDKTFSQKCLDKINEFKEKGKTILFVSHSAQQVKQFCDKILWLEYGRVRSYGPSKEVMDEYEEFIKVFNKMTKEEKEQFQREKRFSNASAD